MVSFFLQSLLGHSHSYPVRSPGAQGQSPHMQIVLFHPTSRPEGRFGLLSPRNCIPRTDWGERAQLVAVSQALSLQSHCMVLSAPPLSQDAYPECSCKAVQTINSWTALGFVINKQQQKSGCCTAVCRLPGPQPLLPGTRLIHKHMHTYVTTSPRPCVSKASPQKHCCVSAVCSPKARGLHATYSHHGWWGGRHFGKLLRVKAIVESTG